MSDLAISLGALVVLYIFLIGDWFHRAWAALGVAVILMLAQVVSLRNAVASVNFNTLGLLVGMMVLVGLLGEAGLFDAVGRYAMTVAHGRQRRLLWAFFLLSAGISAFLDNVTTILLLTPALFRATEAMDVDPVPYIMMMVAASNLGGLATLIGDPPNILIGTAAHFSFNHFLGMLGIPAVILLASLAFVGPWGMKIGKNPQLAARVPDEEPRDFPLESRRPLLLVILGLVMVGFILQRPLHLSSGVIAVIGAALGIVASAGQTKHIWRSVDWGTLGFFLGIFIIVGSLEHEGVIRFLAGMVVHEHFHQWLPLVVLAGSALFSAVLDNVPLVAAMIPLVERLSALHPGDAQKLWVALAMGAAIGGNSTIIGASANVVAQGLAEERGYALQFRRYLPFGLRVFAATVILGAVYIMVWP